MDDLERQVASRARWLDVVKPRWERLVPLTEGKVKMMCGGSCILGWVFGSEAEAEPNRTGYWWATTHYEEETGPLHAVPHSPHGDHPFASHDSLPYWRDEIAARLARWAPSNKVATVPENALAMENVT